MPLAAIWSSVVVSSSAAGGGRNLADTQHTIYTGGEMVAHHPWVTGNIMTSIKFHDHREGPF